jgi:thiol-disulfide isomerase/thioredoxin
MLEENLSSVYSCHGYSLFRFLSVLLRHNFAILGTSRARILIRKLQQPLHSTCDQDSTTCLWPISVDVTVPTPSMTRISRKREKLEYCAQVTVLQENTDKLVLVEFFAPWCASCKALYPRLSKLCEGAIDRVKLFNGLRLRALLSTVKYYPYKYSTLSIVANLRHYRLLVSFSEAPTSLLLNGVVYISILTGTAASCLKLVLHVSKIALGIYYCS